MDKLSLVILFGALANQNRLDILICLQKGQKNVSEIIKFTSLSQSTVSHSLFKLAASGLISSTQQNRFRYYTISSPIIPSILNILNSQSSQ